MDVLLTYASFWQRLGATVVDVLVLLPVGYFVYEGDSKGLLLLSSVLGTVVTTAYPIALHARGGQTVGKWLTGIRVVDVTGARIGWRQAGWRSVVDIVLGIVFEVAYAVELVSIADARFYGVDAATRERNLMNDDLYIYWLGPALMVWMFSEVVVMLFNERRRSVHDFIAGTVVVAGQSRRLGAASPA
jgi:uncharacterized RDD family membrane protein YckC